MLADNCGISVHSNEHYIDVIMSTMASQITSFMIVFPTFYSGAYQWKHQNSASQACVWRIHRSVTFPAQMASNAENASIWWCHHEVRNWTLWSLISSANNDLFHLAYYRNFKAHCHQVSPYGIVKPSLLQVMGCCLLTAKPLPELMLVWH